MGRILCVVTAVLLVAMATLSYGAPTAVKVANMDGGGTYLTDGKGMALYHYDMDSEGRSACSGECLKRWPLYLNEEMTVPPGLNAADFGAITRDDGKKQSTYKGMPLYYFARDKKAGDTAGQGMGNVWHLVSP